MPIYVVTGKLGSGKTLACVGRIKDYLLQNRRVATNLDLNLNKLIGNYSKKCQIFRVPDKPTHFDLENLGLGYDGEFVGEEKNGALFLDECGTWFNSRGWNEAGRQELIDLFRHIRKMRWDVYFIIQDLESMDKQARKAFAEHVVYCRRTDRFNVPFISTIFKYVMDKPLPFPKVHVGFVKYGDSQNSPDVDKWWYRGKQLYDAYDTTQIYSDSYNSGLYQMLPPYYTHGRYTTKFKDFKNAARDFKLKGFHFFLTGVFAASFAVNALVTQLPETPKKGLFSCNDAYKDLYGSCSAQPVLLKEKELVKEILRIKKEGVSSNGKVSTSNNSKSDIKDSPQIVITGSVKSSVGFDYLFTKNDIPFYPRDVGYSVRWISTCKAILAKDSKVTTVYCPETLLREKPPIQLSE